MRPRRSFAHVKRVNGYRSQMEARYAQYLDFLKKSAAVKAWEYEPKTFWFTEPTRRGLKGVRRGATSYRPDFRVEYPDGREEWHEVKGWMSPADAAKLRRFARYYPDEKLVVIDSKYMAALRRQVGGILGWSTASRSPARSCKPSG